jgi:ATP-dependent Clp protease ATP-binding subunit ClpB
MNLGNYTVKAAEIVQQAQQLAFNAQAPSIEPAHILKALIEAPDTPIEYLLKKNNVTLTIVAKKL